MFFSLLAGILFIVSVTGHHQLSPIHCLLSPAVITQPRPFSPTPGGHYPPPAVLARPRPSLPIPGRPLWSPSFLSTRAPSVFLNKCRLPPPPAVLDYTLPSSDTHCSPPRNSGCPAISLAVRLSCRYHACLTIPCSVDSAEFPYITLKCQLKC